MRAQLVSQVKGVVLCASLLALLAPVLVGCGRVVCSVALAPPIGAALTVDNGVVYGVGHKLFAMRASDGAKLWVAQIQDEQDAAYWDSALVDSAAVAAGMVYVAQGGGTPPDCATPGKPPRVLALRDTDGTQRWQVPM